MKGSDLNLTDVLIELARFMIFSREVLIAQNAAINEIGALQNYDIARIADAIEQCARIVAGEAKVNYDELLETARIEIEEQVKRIESSNTRSD